MDQNGAKEASLSPIAGSKGAAKEDAIKQLAEGGIGGGGDGGGILAQLQGNPFFTAGFGLAALGAAVRYGSTGLRRAGELLKHRMLIDLEITKHDVSYPWVLDWMTAQYQRQIEPIGRRRDVGTMEYLFRRFTPGLHHLQIKTARAKTASGSEQTAFSLVPGHGRHILRYRNAFIAVNRERVGKSFDVDGKPFEVIQLTTLYHHRHIFEDIFREAHEMAALSTEGEEGCAGDQQSVRYAQHRRRGSQ